MKVAIFPGTFNPFTKGHADVVKQALSLFDKIIILVAKNPDKEGESSDVITLTISDLYESVNNVEVKKADPEQLTYQIAAQEGADYLIRGIRNTIDFEYEKQIARYNATHGIKTVFFIPSLETEMISSSLVRATGEYLQYCPTKNTIID